MSISIHQASIDVSNNGYEAKAQMSNERRERHGTSPERMLWKRTAVGKRWRGAWMGARSVKASLPGAELGNPTNFGSDRK